MQGAKNVKSNRGYWAFRSLNAAICAAAASTCAVMTAHNEKMRMCAIELSRYSHGMWPMSPYKKVHLKAYMSSIPLKANIKL
jgi:hypothetical protein